MPFRRLTMPILILLCLLVPLGDTAANAATGRANWLSHTCSGAHPTRCVVDSIDVDTLQKKRAIVFYDSRSHKHTVRHRGDLWSIAKKHSHQCGTHGDPHGCYFNDQIMGHSLVMPDGTTIATVFLKK